MTASSGRDGRRRRVLNDGARAAADAAGATMPPGASPTAGERTRRFAPQDDSVSFAIARGLLPTRGIAIAGAMGIGLAATAVALAVHQYGAPFATAFAPVFDLNGAASIGSWLVTTLMLVAAALAFTIYGLRSNRTDDVRGQYRWWFTAGLAGVAASAVYATSLHVVVGEFLGQASGFAPLAKGALWWITASTLAAMVLGFRPLADLKESRWSLTLVVLSASLLVLSACATVGALPPVSLPYQILIQTGGLLGGLVALVGAELTYVRRVLLETDGLIAAPQRKPKPAKREEQESPKKKSEPKQDPAPAKPAVTVHRPEPKPEPAAASEPEPKQATVWTDGADDPDGEYDEEGGEKRRLSKAERKRLRRQKAKGRYAA